MYFLCWNEIPNMRQRPAGHAQHLELPMPGQVLVSPYGCGKEVSSFSHPTYSTDFKVSSFFFEKYQESAGMIRIIDLHRCTCAALCHLLPLLQDGNSLVLLLCFHVPAKNRPKQHMHTHTHLKSMHALYCLYHSNCIPPLKTQLQSLFYWCILCKCTPTFGTKSQKTNASIFIPCFSNHGVPESFQVYPSSPRAEAGLHPRHFH